MKIEALAKDLEKTGFLPELLRVLVDRGFGTLPARETAISVLDLILRKHPEWSKSHPTEYELARLFRASPRKIRGYLDEISYRDSSRSETELCKDLAEVLVSAERISEGSFVIFEIDDGLLRDYARKLVRENAGVFESGISGSVVKMSGQQFAVLSLSLLPESARKKAVAELERVAAQDDKRKGAARQPKSKSILRIALENFASSAGKQAGRKLVDLGFAIATGGLSEVSSIVSIVRKAVS